MNLEKSVVDKLVSPWKPSSGNVDCSNQRSWPGRML